MAMRSDVLVLFGTPLSGDILARAKKALMNVDRSVLVQKPEAPGRVLLVKFDPERVASAGLLDVLRAAGLDARIAGG
jgi:hypothetical protein